MDNSSDNKRWEDQENKIRELESIPVIGKTWHEWLKQAFNIPETEAIDGLELAKRFHELPEDDRRAIFDKYVLSKGDWPILRLGGELVQCAVAINRHDDHAAGERFVSATGSETLPWIWITGEPNTERRKTVSFILTMCSKRSFDRSGLIDCESDDEQIVLERMFGSYFDPIPGKEILKSKLLDMHNGFIIFYRAESMSRDFQKKLLKWRENAKYRREGYAKTQAKPSQDQPEDTTAQYLRELTELTKAYVKADQSRNLAMDLRKVSELRRVDPKARINCSPDQSLHETTDLRRLSELKEEIDTLDIALFFIADRPPQVLVQDNLIMRELVSGSIHIPVPPLRECPRLIIDRLGSLVASKPTLETSILNPLKYWSKEALDVVSSFDWPDNLAGLSGLVDTLFFKGALRSGRDEITEDLVRRALWEMYGPAYLNISEFPTQAGSNEFELLPKTKEPPPDRSKWIEIFQEKYQGKSTVAQMARDYGINRSLLSTTLNKASIRSGQGGRPRKAKRAEDS